MKNLFVIFIFFTCILQSCNSYKLKTSTVDFNNATFLSEQDILKVIELNEIFLASTLQKNNANSLPISNEVSKAASTNQSVYASSNNDCDGFVTIRQCLKGRGIINGNCETKGPCVTARSLAWLIIYYKNADFIKKYQLRLINLKTGEPLTSTDSNVEGQSPFTYFNIQPFLNTNERLGFQYSINGAKRNIPVNITKR